MKSGDIVVLEYYDPDERIMLDCDSRFNYRLKEFHLYQGTITKVIEDPGTNYISVGTTINGDEFKPVGDGHSALYESGLEADDDVVEVWCRKCIFRKGDKGDKFLYTMNNGPITPEN